MCVARHKFVAPWSKVRFFKLLQTNATRMCDANLGGPFFAEGDAFRTVALHNVPPSFAEER